MTKEEKCIVSAYTGVLMINVSDFREWLSKKGYTDPLIAFTPEMADKMFDKLKGEVKKDFLKLCEVE